MNTSQTPFALIVVFVGAFAALPTMTRIPQAPMRATGIRARRLADVPKTPDGALFDDGFGLRYAR